MKFAVAVDVMPARGISDPQGQTVERALPSVGVDGATEVRVGKHITFTVEAANESEAHSKAETACRELLANTVIEDYAFTVEVHEGAGR